MMTRFALAAALTLVALFPASAATKRPPIAPPPAPVVLPDTVRVALNTELGTITVDLDYKHAPITVRNFVTYVDQKRFDGIVFYRSMHLPWGDPPNGLIQAGTQGDPRRVLKPIAHEPTNLTGILHKAGTLSMARYGPGTATGDFSLLLSDLPGLDADPKAQGDKDGYAAFGHVVSGMDVARRIFDAPISATKGEGFLKGQMIEQPIKILTARRIPIPPTADPAPAVPPAAPSAAAPPAATPPAGQP